jgi:uncharacterized Ntn-hydrolase superfamily protein
MYNMHDPGPLVTTFSIVGYDPDAPAWGIAVSSRFLAVGARTCWGAPNAGVVVVQAHLNTQNGRDGVDLLKQGVAASEVIQRLMAKDPHRDLRQMAVVDSQGGISTYTGARCGPWAGGVTGAFCAAQGNMLLGGEGCAAMVEHFSTARGSLARRLVDALTIGDEVAGDSRGRQATALYIVRPPWAEAFDVFTEPTIDLRVDDHENPFAELSRLLDLWELLFLPATEEERLPPNPPTVLRLQRVLTKLKYYSGKPHGALDDATLQAIKSLARMQNFRKRLFVQSGGASTPELLPWIDRRLLEHLETKVGLA